jgi:hypothetical protein
MCRAPRVTAKAPQSQRRRPDNLNDVVAALFQRLIVPRGLSLERRARWLERLRRRESPTERAQYFRCMLGAWAGLQVALTVATAGLLAIADAILGHDRQVDHVGASVFAGLATFCVWGAGAACWWYCAALWADRVARRHGTSSDSYGAALTRATSRRTVPVQVISGMLVMVLVLTT